MARLRLSNDVEYDFEVTGRPSGETAVLSLAGDPTDPASEAIRIRTTVTPLEDGAPTLQSFSGRGYGQTLAW